MTKPEIAVPSCRTVRAVASAALALACTCALGAGVSRACPRRVCRSTSTRSGPRRSTLAPGVWLDYAPGLYVDCAPPAGCYAYKQRIYYVFNCAPRWAAPIERISMNLNGNVVNRQTRDTSEPYAPQYDESALVFNAYCPLRDLPR